MKYSVEDKKEAKSGSNASNVDIKSSESRDVECNKDSPHPSQGVIDENRPQSIDKKAVSIDVTKALVLLGFDSWSSLEPGNCTLICLCLS